MRPLGGRIFGGDERNKTVNIFNTIPELLGGVCFGQTPPIQAELTFDGELGETDKHNSKVNLTKGQILNFLVEKRGVDVVLRIYTANGKFHDRVDSPNVREGDQPFKMVSLNGGRYRAFVP